MTAEERLALAERALERSRADATEIMVTTAHTALTRFAHEMVPQNVDASDTIVRIRAIVDGRTGVASTNVLEDTSLNATLARAYELAAFSPREAIAPAVAGPADVLAPPGAYVEGTAQATAADRARVAGDIFTHAQANKLWSAGYVTTSSDGITIATSAGARQSFDRTNCGANVKMTGADATGFAERYANDTALIDGNAVGARAAQKAVASANPLEVEPGAWTVIMEPAAFGEVLAYLGNHFSAQSFDEGSSFITGRLGERVLGANVTLRDDYTNALNPGMPFDYEGTPKQRVALVENGVATDVVTDTAWARKLQRHNTGHGLPAPNAIGPLAQHLTIDPGTKSLDTLIAETRRGLLITRLWYVRVVDGRKTILTGMTRDGTFLIENGSVTRGVHNLRFNQSLADALNACEFGDQQQRTGSYGYSMVIPPVKFENFNFASSASY